MSAKAVVIFLMTFMSTGNPMKANVTQIPETGFDLRVREWHADKLPTSYQLTLTVAFK